MKRIIIFLLLSCLFHHIIVANALFIEINQMLSINLGYEISNESELGFRTSIGVSPFDVKAVSYSALFFYTFFSIDDFSSSIEIGLPLGYFDLLENKYVDWDPIIDSPYAGWLSGVTIRGLFWNTWALKLGISYWTEWQEDDGFKNGIIPLVSVDYLILK